MCDKGDKGTGRCHTPVTRQEGAAHLSDAPPQEERQMHTMVPYASNLSIMALNFSSSSGSMW